MKIVVALGGNALLRRGERLTAAAQAANIAIAAGVLAGLVEAGHSLAITHGNGPQVGVLALEAEQPGSAEAPLDVLDAQTEGWIGYQLELALAGLLPKGTEIATLLTCVRVDAADPAFGKPAKPIGPVYDEAAARRIAQAKGWSIAPDGKGWRRVVASPEPLEILNRKVIRRLADAGVIIICAGGGGIPVAEADGRLQGVEAVVDKDSTSALLAQGLAADFLLILTDVDGVYVDYGMPDARRLDRAHPDQLQGRHFAAGSMGPKLAAACRFVRETGRPAAIGRLEDAAAVLQGVAGTRIG